MTSTFAFTRSAARTGSRSLSPLIVAETWMGARPSRLPAIYNRAVASQRDDSSVVVQSRRSASGLSTFRTASASVVRAPDNCDMALAPDFWSGEVTNMTLRHHICPRCFSEHVARDLRHGSLEHLMRLLGWRMYACIDCGTRFYDRPLKATSARY